MGCSPTEAGLGSAPMAHAASSTDEPAEQAMWGVFEVFVDTIVICTITSLTVLLSGLPSGGGRPWTAIPPMVPPLWPPSTRSCLVP